MNVSFKRRYKIKCGSIEIEEIVSKRKFSSNSNIDEQLEKLDKNTPNNTQNNAEDIKMNTKKTITKPVIEKMILANQILNNIENISFTKDQSFKSKITKFDGKIVECDSFPSPIGTVCKLL